MPCHSPARRFTLPAVDRAVFWLALLAGRLRRGRCAQGAASGEGPWLLAAEELPRRRASNFATPCRSRPTTVRLATRTAWSTKDWAIMREAAQFYQGAIDTDAGQRSPRAPRSAGCICSPARPEKALETIRPSMAKASRRCRPPDRARRGARAAQGSRGGAGGCRARRASSRRRSEDAIGGAGRNLSSRRATTRRPRRCWKTPCDQALRTPWICGLALAQLYAALHEEPKVEAMLDRSGAAQAGPESSSDPARAILRRA
jgi:hypothetical protein